MPSEARRAVKLLWIYAVAAVLLGAWAAPFFYNAGKALSEISGSKEMNALLKWLAQASREAEFPAFFRVSVLVTGGVLLLPFVEWLRGGQGGRSVKSVLGPLLGGRRPLRHGVLGWLLVVSLLLLFTGLEWKSLGGKSLLAALALAGMTELLFRGIAQGIFQRVLRPKLAVAASAALFALIVFLVTPHGRNVADAEASGVGFELLGKTLTEVFSWNFVALFLLGWVLSHARWRTGSLVLSIGLSAGWHFAGPVEVTFTSLVCIALAELIVLKTTSRHAAEISH